ncbi:MAG: hypothetical protein K2Q18_12170 [Bdellovibrionales bacterium]|nr:hypothetical protein [Bdellovibrionales bacterium]
MPLKTFLFFTFLNYSLMAAENVPWKSVQNLKCLAEFEKLIEIDNLKQEVFREHIGAFNETVYRNRSSIIGHWSEVHLKEGGSPILYKMDNEAVTKKSFDKDCKTIISLEIWPWEFQKVLGKKTSEDWDNNDLKDQISSGKKGMIYYWSPKFTYSVTDLRRVKDLAKKFGYEFTSIVDPRVGKSEVLDSLKAINLEQIKNVKMNRVLAKSKPFLRNTSTDLYLRSGFNHFPVIYIYNNKKIHSRFITGVMADEGLKNLADTFSSEVSGEEL